MTAPSATIPARRGAYPLARFGIIGGGQLGRMMTVAAKKLGCHVVVLDPFPQSPAGLVATEQVTGSFTDPACIREVVTRCDATTYDIEHIDTQALTRLEAEGYRVLPAPALLECIQDKLRQKEAYRAAGLPTAEFVAVDEPGPEAFEAFGYPLAQKTRTGGYDGRGVALLHAPEDAAKALSGPCILERLADIQKELAVIVARGADGDTRAYPVTEMVFDPRANLLDLLLSPARIPDPVADAARELACATVQALDGVGIFGVEVFLTRAGELLVNEIAPRPHNSGHYTIEACHTSQFEQHVRAVLGLPLGSTRQHTPCAMLNLVGGEGEQGPPVVEGLDAALGIPGVSVHLYGKAETRPFRKMGHVTVLDETVDAAAEKASRVREKLRIGAA